MLLAKGSTCYTIDGAFYREDVSKGRRKAKAESLKSKLSILSPFIALYRGRALQNTETY